MTEELKSWWALKLAASLVIIILMTLILVSPVLSMDQRSQPPSVGIIETDPIEGTVGCTYEKEVCSPIRNLILYNNSILDQSIEWTQARGREYEAYTSPEGVTLDMDVTSAGAAIRFRGYLSIPVVNYTKMMFNTSISVLKGNVRIQFYVSFTDWPDYGFREGGNVEIEALAGESYNLSVSPFIESLYDLNTDWMARAEMSIYITTYNVSTITVGNVEVSVESQEDLYPATFDIQAPDGNSLFENQYINDAGGEDRHDRGDRTILFPAFHLTTCDNYSYHASAYGPRITNETIYLPKGYYTGFAGWIRDDWIPAAFRTACNFTISENERIFVTARIPVRKLFLRMEPEFPYTCISVRDYSYIWFDSNEDYLYLYPSSSLNIRLFPMSYSTFGAIEIYQYGNRIAPADIYIEDLEGNSTLTVRANYPHLAIGPLVLDSGHLLWLTSSCILCVIILIAIQRLFSQTGFKRRLAPVVPLLLSILFPWVQFEYGKGTTTIVSSIFVPFTTTMWTGENGVLAFVPTSYLIPSPFIIGLVFWLPLTALLYTPIIHTKIDNLRLIGGDLYDYETKGLILLGPFLLATYYLYICITGGLLVGFGLIAAFAFTPTFLAACYYWPNQQISENKFKS